METTVSIQDGGQLSINTDDARERNAIIDGIKAMCSRRGIKNVTYSKITS